MASCRTLLLETSISDLKTLQRIVLLKDTCSVDQALKTLAQHKILSAPVVVAHPGAASAAVPAVEVPAAAGEQHGDILGFIDIKDVLTSFLKEMDDVQSLVGMRMLARMRYLEDKGAAWACKQLKDLSIIGSDGDFLHLAQGRVSLMHLVMYGLLEPRKRGMHGGAGLPQVVHRVALFDNTGAITNIISQTDILAFLNRKPEAFAEIGGQTVQQLGFCPRPVHSTGPEASAIEALALMAERKVSSLAVVDGVGKLIGNFSISDMRSIMAEHFGALALPVGEYLALGQGTEFMGYTRISEDDVTNSLGHKFITDRYSRSKPRTPGEEVGQSLVLCRPDSTLLEVVALLVGSKIHRVYVIDDKEQPVGIVTMTDVLRKVVELTH